MFGLGMPELIVILLIVLIVFGVGKLPEIGEGLGKAIRGFKKGVSEEEPDQTDLPSDRTHNHPPHNHSNDATPKPPHAPS
jgi:sec-independent protein translocase protein TatA